MSTREKLRLIKSAREAGYSDIEILEVVLRGEFGSTHRRKMIVEWGGLLGLKPDDALRLAFRAGLIASVHAPRDASGETLPDKDQEKSGE